MEIPGNNRMMASDVSDRLVCCKCGSMLMLTLRLIAVVVTDSANYFSHQGLGVYLDEPTTHINLVSELFTGIEVTKVLSFRNHLFDMANSLVDNQICPGTPLLHV
jgi:hypothetical protein